MSETEAIVRALAAGRAPTTSKPRPSGPWRRNTGRCALCGAERPETVSKAQLREWRMTHEEFVEFMGSIDNNPRWHTDECLWRRAREWVDTDPLPAFWDRIPGKG